MMLELKAMHLILLLTTLPPIALTLVIPEVQAKRQQERTSLSDFYRFDSLRQLNVDPVGTQILAQQQEPRTALVIGNAAYSNDPLSNPINDATDVAQTLEELGFAVTLLTDSDWRTMDVAIEKFSQQLQQGGVGVFYYAGHGVQVNGVNYLVPIDAELERERDVLREALSLNYVINLMEQAEAGVNILIIDACRDNPFYRQWRSVRGAFSERGLALAVPPQGTIISFATEPGGFANDGNGRNSPYTENLLKHIRSEGEDVATMFRRVRADTIDSTNGDQVPWYQEPLIGSFSFNPVSEVTVSPTPTNLPSPNPPPSTPDVISTQRVVLPEGQDSVLIANTTSSGRVRRYVINLREGETWIVEISNATAQTFFNVRLPSGESLANSVDFWEEAVRMAGDYFIDVSAVEDSEFTLRVRKIISRGVTPD
jgi:hypothetical protein